ncbi:MAG TPA: hypothetical protein VFD02_02815 [Syntrophomonadaceae bacterium]|nr:hypothetical protein [Syntrophomonadaceae bacterium]
MKENEDKRDYTLNNLPVIVEKDSLGLCSANYNLGLGCIPIS